METKSELHFEQIKNDELRKTIKAVPISEEVIPKLSTSPQKTITDDIIKAVNKYYKLKADYEKKYRKTIKNIKDNDSLPT